MYGIEESSLLNGETVVLKTMVSVLSMIKLFVSCIGEKYRYLSTKTELATVNQIPVHTQ